MYSLHDSSYLYEMLEKSESIVTESTSVVPGLGEDGWEDWWRDWLQRGKRELSGVMKMLYHDGGGSCMDVYVYQNLFNCENRCILLCINYTSVNSKGFSEGLKIRFS